MGVVFEALDRERNQRVALKLLQALDAAALYRFKREFRSLVDVAHPNLITLHELVSSGSWWFFTMELIEGRDFLSRLRAGGRPHAAPEIPLLRALLRQLVTGVAALHEAGMVHRDLKPPNVLVSGDDRVVILDFGLIADLRGRSLDSSRDIVGTAAYMAPEQVDGGKIGPATDWYAVGVMLFEALTGQQPFTGTFMEVLLAKSEPPPPPSALTDGVPEDLDELCRRLLSPRPADRPDDADVLQALRASVPAAAGDDVGFVGRERHLHTLREALDAAQSGRATTVFVRGESGMGKSTLVRRFLDGVAQDGEAVLLEGRCYLRESVPYKAVDSLIDALSRHLRGMPDEQVAAALPPHVQALSRVFPVLRRVEAIAASRRGEDEMPSALELRRRAVIALRELLDALAGKRPFVLYIDDLQWGDVDSASVLFELMRPPDPPPVLLLAAFRSEEVAHSQALRAVLRRFGTLGATVRELAVGPLTTAESQRLAGALLGDQVDRAEDVARTIAWEAGGNPFFVRELARHARSGAVLGESIALEDVIRARVAGLTDDARRLLEIISVAAGPLPLATAEHAAEVDDGSAAALLSAQHLIRARGERSDDAVECYHDRIRETVVAGLDADTLRARHWRLAIVLETAGGADAETLAIHWRDAGEPRPAADYALAAANDAAEALAFERAAKLYRIALELRPEDERHHAIEVKRADALANAGRGAEAAEGYLAAAKHAGNRGELVELQRRAAEQLLRTGHVDAGLEVVGKVLGAVGLRYSRTPQRALVSLLWQRARIRLRGMRFSERDTSSLRADDLLAVDTCWSISTGLGMVDLIRAAECQSRHLLLALRLGEPYRVARALSAEAAFTAGEGVRRGERALALCERADELATRAGDPHGIGLVRLARTLTAFAFGQWREVVQHAKPAIAIFRNRCRGAQWELGTARHLLLWSLVYLGELAELPRRIPAALREAEDHGDLYSSHMLRTGLLNQLWLLDDDVVSARAQLELAEEAWTQRGFTLQHYNALLSAVNINLYSGAADAALARVSERWGWMAHSLLDRVEQIRIEARFLRARAHLAGGDLAAATRDAHQLARERASWAAPLAAMVRGGVARARGDLEGALVALRHAETAATASDMPVFAAVARYRRGEAIGGDEGHALVAEVERDLRARGIARPERWADMLLPVSRGGR